MRACLPALVALAPAYAAAASRKYQVGAFYYGPWVRSRSDDPLSPTPRCCC